MSIVFSTRYVAGLSLALVTSVSIAAEPIKITHRLVSLVSADYMNTVTLEITVSNIGVDNLRNVKISSKEISLSNGVDDTTIESLASGSSWTGYYTTSTAFEVAYFPKNAPLTFEISAEDSDAKRLDIFSVSDGGE